jgi:hypothetical protein
MISNNEDCGTGRAAEELAKAEKQAAIEEECSQLKIVGEDGAYANEHIYINNRGNIVKPSHAKYISEEACYRTWDYRYKSSSYRANILTWQYESAMEWITNNHRSKCDGRNGSRKYLCRPMRGTQATSFRHLTLKIFHHLTSVSPMEATKNPLTPKHRTLINGLSSTHLTTHRSL